MEALKVFVFTIFKPLKAFRIVKEKWGFKIYWFTALLILIITVVSSYVIGPKMQEYLLESQIQTMRENFPEMEISEEQIKQFSGIGAFTNIMMIVSPIVGSIIGWLFIALIYWGLILVFGGESNYNKTFTLVIISSVPILISKLVNTFYTLYTGKLIIHQGLSGLVASGKILSDAANPIYLILSRIDIFILWGLILLILGFVISCKMKVWKSALTVLIVLILGLIISFVGVSISRRFMPQL